MGRRRYVSTDISTDARIRKLAEQSEFAALLYTWMIPHALDDATITADADELLMLVVPGFRWRTTEDVAEALGLMLSAGLLVQAGDRLRFPEKSFYHYQSYIGEARRTAEATPEPTPPRRKTPHIAAEPREVPQNAASSSSSSSSSISFSSSETPPVAPPRGKARRVTLADEEFQQTLEDEYWQVLGSRQAVRDCIDLAMSHKALLKCTNQQAYLRNWLRKEGERKPPPRNGRVVNIGSTQLRCTTCGGTTRFPNDQGQCTACA